MNKGIDDANFEVEGDDENIDRLHILFKEKLQGIDIDLSLESSTALTLVSVITDYLSEMINV